MTRTNTLPATMTIHIQQQDNDDCSHCSSMLHSPLQASTPQVCFPGDYDDDELKGIVNEKHSSHVLIYQQKMSRLRIKILVSVIVTLLAGIFAASLLSSTVAQGSSSRENLSKSRRLTTRISSIRSNNNSLQQQKQQQKPFWTIITTRPEDDRKDLVANKVLQDLTAAATENSWTVLALNRLEQEQYLQQQASLCGNAALSQFQQLANMAQFSMSTEVFKYCALLVSLQEQQADQQQQQPAVWMDASNPLLVSVPQLLQPYRQQNVAVLTPAYWNAMHGSFLLLQPSTEVIAMVRHLLSVLTSTSLEVLLQDDPLLVSRTLYQQVSATAYGPDSNTLLMPGENGASWYLLQQSCWVDPIHQSFHPNPGDSGDSDQRTSMEVTVQGSTYLMNFQCPARTGFCCSISDSTGALSNDSTLFMTRHLLHPLPVIAVEKLPKPYNAEAGHYKEEELPYIAMVSEQVHVRPMDFQATPNFFDMLLVNDCLPSDDRCSKCLRDKQGATCQSCASVCPCYCKTLCHETVPKKFVSKTVTVQTPLYQRDPTRLIPRIVHQTWFEELSPDKYPNMSRLQASFQNSGWEYKFYSDDDARNFLSTHFPAEVRQAYDALLPGAFKADLFRYCALLIHGGVYADVDILLESNLDLAIAPDVGFAVPMDEPGTPVNRRMCLWNGLIAAAPGHPFLAKAIEIVVNQVRNRFTSVDVDATFCPKPELSIMHAFDTLFTAGPCLLGSAMNRVLGRHGQTPFEAGELQHARHVPGRTVILQQNKWDMGAHRFTLLDENLVVAATDLPDSNDRLLQQQQQQQHASKDSPPLQQTAHYSKTHAKTGIYGLEHLYADRNSANEEIEIRIASSLSSKRTHKDKKRKNQKQAAGVATS